MIPDLEKLIDIRNAPTCSGFIQAVFDRGSASSTRIRVCERESEEGVNGKCKYPNERIE